MAKNEVKKRNGFSDILVNIVKYKYIFIGLLIIVITVALYTGFGNPFKTESKSTTLGLRNIGELSSQVAYVTEVSQIEDPRTLWGVEIPFTKTNVVFSYDFVIKAGFNFENIEPKIDTKKKTIKFTLPQPHIMSNEINPESLKVYFEKESIFNNLTFNEQNKAIIQMRQDAQKTAIDNGLLDSAKEHVKVLLTSLLSDEYNPKEYKYSFEFK